MMSLRLAVVLGALAAACAGPQSVAPAAAHDASFAEARRIDLPPPGALMFSRDDQTMLVNADFGSGARAFAQDLGSGELTRLGGLGEAAAISYFPADNRVLLRQAGAGGARLVVRLESGEIRPITGDGAAGAFVGWRADGGVFWAVTHARDGAGSALHEIDAARYNSRLVLASDSMRISAISGDGRWLALLETKANGDIDLHLMDLSAATPAPRLITAHDGIARYGVFEFSRDGRGLIYAHDLNGHIQAWRHDLATNAQSVVMEAQADVVSIVSSASGNYRVYATGRDGEAADVIVVDQRSDRALALSGDVRDVRFNRAETEVAFRLISDAWSNDIFMVEIDEPTRIRRAVHAPAARAN